jgi:two-component system, LytTR family, response regulator
MKKISYLAIDDEPLALEVIEEHAEKIPFLKSLGFFNDPFECMNLISSADIIFIDIKMPSVSGIEWVRSVRPSASIVFTTAYPDYAMEGFQLEVLDYLMKPISFEKFYRSINKFLKMQGMRSESSTPEKDSQDFIFVKTERKIVKVRFETISYIRGLKDYISIHLKDGKKIFCLLNLKDLADRLPEEKFLRIHKSYIINLEEIESISNQKIQIGEEFLPVGAIYQEYINAFVKKYKIE